MQESSGRTENPTNTGDGRGFALKQAFPVDMSLPVPQGEPQNAEEYLRLASHLSSLYSPATGIGEELVSSHVTERTYRGDIKMEEEDTTFNARVGPDQRRHLNHLLPADAWQDAFTDAFGAVREAIAARRREKAEGQNPRPYPKQDLVDVDEESLKDFCTLDDVIVYDQLTVNALLCKLFRSSSPHYLYQAAPGTRRFLFALLACLDRPLLPHVASMMREFVYEMYEVLPKIYENGENGREFSEIMLIFLICAKFMEQGLDLLEDEK